MVRLTVPSAQALTTSLETGTREALETLARALAQEIEATVDRAERMTVVRAFRSVVRDLDLMDRADRRERRMASNHEQSSAFATARLELAREAMEAKRRAPEPVNAAPSFIDELSAKRDRRTRHAG